MYPYEASILVANGFDIYYDPHYESPYDTRELDRRFFGNDYDERYYYNEAVTDT